jgi:hypothetical protein
MEGAAEFFQDNACRLLDFFAALVARNIEEGKRTLLVSRKCFLPWCRSALQRRLQDLVGSPMEIVTGDWDQHDLAAPGGVALINYGVSGINLFEQFEAAYCLNSYYVPPQAIAGAVQDIESSKYRYPFSIVTDGNPPRRRVTVEIPTNIEPITRRIAQLVLDQKEAEVVIQAVGRVRPFTSPREVITQHCSDLPGVPSLFEFRTLSQARDFFLVKTPKQARIEERRQQAAALRASGCQLKVIAACLKVSLATVKRDLGAVAH